MSTPTSTQTPIPSDPAALPSRAAVKAAARYGTGHAQFRRVEARLQTALQAGVEDPGLGSSARQADAAVLLDLLVSRALGVDGRAAGRPRRGRRPSPRRPRRH